MQSIHHLSPEEQEHFIQCACGEFVDMRDLSQVFAHLHSAMVPQAEWSYSVKKGDPSAYPRKGGSLGLN
jgi:hypothetical protein